MRFRSLGLAFLVAAIVARASNAADLTSEQVQFFEQKIRPVLIEHCYECHGPELKTPKGGLSLDSRAAWERGGDSGEPAIVPGKPDASPLIRFVRHDDPGMEMPPEKPRLPETVIADLVEWVRIGAPDPRSGVAEIRRADKSWWSLQPLLTDPPPTPGDLPPEWAGSAIDRFIFEKLHESGLSPNPPADRRTLIRRLSYDLTGLPPTRDEVTAFEGDSGADAYERLVDRLLDSPRYGERWGRHWLDVVRFGESRGFERNEIIPDAWPFRDYVIRSFNEDKPFDQFITEHLAGDIVAADRPLDAVGVAFLTIGPYDDVGNQDPVAAANIRAATVDDMVTATGSAFLGLTINCAKCHHHKFDPIPTEDYYRIKSAFDGVTHGSRPLATTAEREQFDAAMKELSDKRGQLVEERNQIAAAIITRADAAGPVATPRPAPSAHLTEEKFPPVDARWIRLSILASSDNPASGVGARLDEFEVWTGGEQPRNVALAASGAVAKGPALLTARDFSGAYGPELVNDGKYGSRWFSGAPPVLTVELPRVESIERVIFSHDRTALSDTPVGGQGPSVAEYEIEISLDGATWRKIADSFDRAAMNDGLARERKLRKSTTDDDRTRQSEIDRQIAAVDQQIAAVPRLPTAWQGTFRQPGEATVVFRGGDPQQRGDLVAPASLNVLDRVCSPFELASDAPEADRRVALARWITSRENPLTARVLANRLWHYHFGVGIVDTPGDFGFLGGKPTHPQLLDWLARRLQDSGWKLKDLHREIVLSQTYRQSSTYRDDAGAVDRDARLLWRFPPRRLEAEEVRDTMLVISGKLDLTAGGPGFRLYEYQQDNVATYKPLNVVSPETYRRAVYHQNARASVVDVLSDFDLPDNAFAAPRRGATTTPLQALTLLNHQFVLDMSAALAERVATEAPQPSDQIPRLYQLAFQRLPTPEEQQQAEAVAKTFGLRAVCRALLNANELVFVE